MLKFIHADLYRIFHRLYFYLLTASIAGLCILVNFALSQSPDNSLTRLSWSMALSFLTFPAMLMPMLTELVTGEEFREHTLKNTLSFGISRKKLFASKLITSTILGVILGAAALASYCGSSLLFLRRDAGFTDAFIRDFFSRVGIACVIYAAGVVMATFLSVCFRRNSLSIFAYYGLLFLSPYFFTLLRLSVINKYLLVSQFKIIASGNPQQAQTALLIGVITLAVFALMEMFSLKRKDFC